MTSPDELSPDQIQAFARDGYLVIPGFLSESELEPIEAIYSKFHRGEVSGMGRDLCDMSGPYTRRFEDFEIINAVLPRTYEPALCDNVFERHAEHVARQLIGDDVTLDYDQFLTKKPHCPGAQFAMHQDLGYWPTGTPGTATTTCSLALDDATLENGCLQVVPGSHQEQALRPHRPVLQEGEGPRDGSHTLSIELKPEDELVPLPVRRGDITVHNERIVHGSGGNPSANWRRTYVIAHRTRAIVEYERAIGFTHSHNDTIQWTTHLEALDT